MPVFVTCYKNKKALIFCNLFCFYVCCMLCKTHYFNDKTKEDEFMKKLTAILLSVIILVCSSVLVQAEDKEYDVTVTMPEVFYYDAEYASTGNENLFHMI